MAKSGVRTREQPFRQYHRRALSRSRPRCTDRADRGRPGQRAPPFRASGYGFCRPGLRLRCPRRCCVGVSQSSTRMPGRPRSPATPWCPASTRGAADLSFGNAAVVLAAVHANTVAVDGPDSRGARHRRDGRDHHPCRRVGVYRPGCGHATTTCSSWTRRCESSYCASPDLAACSRVSPLARISSSCSSNQTVWYESTSGLVSQATSPASTLSSAARSFAR